MLSLFLLKGVASLSPAIFSMLEQDSKYAMAKAETEPKGETEKSEKESKEFLHHLHNEPDSLKYALCSVAYPHAALYFTNDVFLPIATPPPRLLQL